MPLLEIYIILNGKDYGMRRWSAVPRIGDHLTIGDPGYTTVVKVVDVAWGVTPASRRGDTDAAVNLYCEGAIPYKGKG